MHQKYGNLLLCSLCVFSCGGNLPPEELVGMFLKLVEPSESHKSFMSLLYIKGVTEPLSHVLKKHDISVINKPMTTLQQQFPV